MPDLEEMTPGEVLADASVADFIRELGLGVAAAQTALDDNSVRQMEAFTRLRDDLGGRSLLDLGLSPAFYHYQYADITCSMQIRLEVGRSSEFGFGLRFGLDQIDANTDARRSERTEERSGESTGTRTARLTMRSDSRGALSVNGRTFEPTGTDPTARLASLRGLLAAGDSGIDTLVFSPPATAPAMALTAPTDRVVVASPTVTFLRPDSDAALIRVRAVAATDYVVNTGLTVSTVSGQPDLAAHAAHVRERFQAAGFARTTHIDPATVGAGGVGSQVFTTRSFPTGVHELVTEDLARLSVMARIIRAIARPVRIEGFTDRQGAPSRNLALGQARSDEVYRYLLANGVPAALMLVTTSRGERPAQEARDPDGRDNPDWRIARIYLTSITDHYVVADDGPDFAEASLAPDNRTADAAANGFIVLWEASPLGLAGNGVTIEGQAFPFSGTAGGGNAAGTAEAHAFNLAAAVNAAAGLAAVQTGNVVRVSNDADAYDVQLFTTTDREVRLDESTSFIVTERFRSTSSEIASTDTSRNRAIAVGVTIDQRSARQFNMEVTGNSRISARLISIPAPVAFLEQIRVFQAERDA